MNKIIRNILIILLLTSISYGLAKYQVNKEYKKYLQEKKEETQKCTVKKCWKNICVGDFVKITSKIDFYENQIGKVINITYTHYYFYRVRFCNGDINIYFFDDFIKQED